AAAAVRDDARALGAGRALWLPVVASVGVAAGHLLVLAVAVRAADVALPWPEAAGLLVVVLVASSLPLSIAGWGPREGAAAWAFGAAGLGAATGVTVATLYGVLSLLAAAPGALVLAFEALARPARHARPDPMEAR
ncbi:lysylphosphatidylglycerol synthase domain-containing protein, partial [Nocardioides sp. YIM 152588]|uniref:lysylphosphatidylglycerol synthase domain-containing protein n=1 Tax=Nocardioides sp. YIM 152588 TaxID=3158259 RepID=UPI0032E42B1F